MSDTPRDFASRWSERRRRVREEADEPTPIERDEEQDTEREAMLARNREAAEAVDLDGIDEATDMSVFLREGVPDLLRRQALRRLWRSNPVFANVDRLNDYDENFADPSRTLATFQSAWQAGRGYLFPDDDGAKDGEAHDAERSGDGLERVEVAGNDALARSNLVADNGTADGDVTSTSVADPAAQALRPVGTAVRAPDINARARAISTKSDAAANEPPPPETVDASSTDAFPPQPDAPTNASATPSLRARLGL